MNQTPGQKKRERFNLLKQNKASLRKTQKRQTPKRNKARALKTSLKNK